MKRGVRVDLHIHTCLSPCADNGMVPKTIVEIAKQKGIGMIAVCDHNSMKNAGAVIKAARGSGIAILCGMEVTSKEEVHTLAIFEDLRAAARFQSYLWDNLPGKNDPDTFGEQLIVDENGYVQQSCERLLIGATDIGIDEISRKIREAGALAIPSHIDREGFGIIGQLGFIPEGLEFDALEISYRMTLEEARERFKEYDALPFLRSSDAHYPEEIGRGFCDIAIGKADFASLRDYLKEEKGVEN